MNRAAVAVLALGAGLYGLKLASDAAAVAQAQADESGADGGAGLSMLAGFGQVNPWAGVLQGVEQREVEKAMYSANVYAALEAIKWAEGTARDPDPYSVCYGYRYRITNFADHPKALGLWHGESLNNLGPAYAGKVSTAAGAYQIIYPTWVGCKRALGLRDFSPAAQDAAAVYLLKKRGALQLIEAGRMREALPLMAKEWASMPASTAGQPTRKESEVLARYEAAGGVLA
jgi:muramidase (phage lysozyme)